MSEIKNKKINDNNAFFICIKIVWSYFFYFFLLVIFISGRLTLDEACWVGGQCTGTLISGFCLPNQDKNGTLLCHCSTGFIRHNSNCLPGTFCNFACVFFKKSNEKV